MLSMVVAITSDSRVGSKMAARLKGALRRRGLRVQFLKDPQIPRSESDILLLSCRTQKIDQLADEITQEWTHRWLEWYASRKAPI